MRFPSGVTDQYIYFMAVDSTDYVTPETGLSSFTVRRSRNGGASAAYTTPTINETDSSNMPGVYELLLDEDMTLDAGDHSQEVCLRITQASMAPVTLKFEIYCPDVTAGETVGVSSGAVSNVTTTATATAVTTVNGLAANTITAAAAASDFGTEVGTAVWASGTRTLTAGTNIALAKGTGVTGFNDLSAAQVNAEVDTALADYDAPTNAEMVARTLASADYATASALTTVDNEIAVIDGIVDSILVDTAVIGAAGAGLTAVPWNASWDAEVQSEVTDALNAYDPPTKAELDSAVAPLATSSALSTTDGKVDDVKTKTDQMTFGVTNTLNANVTYVNEVEVTGDGELGTEWGPA